MNYIIMILVLTIIVVILLGFVAVLQIKIKHQKKIIDYYRNSNTLDYFEKKIS